MPTSASTSNDGMAGPGEKAGVRPIGIVGIGVMGMPMARRLLACGFDVIARDIRPEAVADAAAGGMRIAASPTAIGAAADTVIVMVVDAPQVEQVLFGAEGLVSAISARGDRTQPATVLLCSTIGPDDTMDFAHRLAAHGIDLVDAPVSGGPQRALAGALSMMLAAAPAVRMRIEPVVASLADKRFDIGARPGDAAKVKLVNNLLAGANLAAAAEAMALGLRLGLDAQVLSDVIGKSSGASWVGGDRMPRMLDDDFAPRAAVTLLTKDLGLATVMARGVAQPTPVADAALAVFRRAVDAGHGALDDAAIIKTYTDPDGAAR